MKNTFFHLSREKQSRIINASLEEFASAGYNKATLDNIIRIAGISKGGLYEYIDSKEELFLYLIEFAYDSLYQYILKAVEISRQPLPPGILDKIRFVSAVAVDFYLDQVPVIAFIVRCSTAETRMKHHNERVFNKHFDNLFSNSDFSAIRFDSVKILNLLKWLLMKTRNDFLDSLKTLEKPDQCRQAYLDEWDFFLDVLKSGIYTPDFHRRT